MPVKFDRIFINDSLQVTAGRIDMLTRGVQALRDSLDKDTTIVDKPIDKPVNPGDSISGLPEIIIPIVGTIEEIYLNDQQQIVVVDAEGNEQVLELEKDPETGDYVPVQVVDDAGNTYVVDSEGKVEKVEGGDDGDSEQVASNDSQDFDPTEYLLDEVLKDFQQRIQGWLSVHGKGPLSRQEYLFFENLPGCLPAEYKVVRSANGILENMFTYNDFKNEFYQKIKTENSELLAPLEAKITSPTENIKDVLNEEELAKVENAVCKPLLTETENYLDFYHDVVDRLNSDDLKEIYQKVKQFFARIGCDNFKSKDDEGIIPYCFWKDADEMVIPFAAGMVDAGYMEIEGLRNLPQFVNELRGNLSYLAYAYTIGSIRCSPLNLNENQQAFDRVYEDLLAYDDLEDPSFWEEWCKKGAQREYDELIEYFEDCQKVDEYKENVQDLIEIISTYDEVIEDVVAIYDAVETYLGVLEKGDVEGWYARGKLTLQVGTVFIGVGTITKITKVKTVINGLKQALRSGSFSKFVDDLLKKSKGVVDEGAGKLDYKLALGNKINNLSDAPEGYRFFKRPDGSTGLKRLDASNEKFPRLTTDSDGVISLYSGPDRLSNSYWAKKNVETALGRPVPANHQIHHLAPDNVVKSHPLYQEGLKRGIDIYDIDQATNLRVLAQSNEAKVVGLSDKFPTHSGSHPNWDKIVKAEADQYSQRLIQRYGSLDKVPEDVLKRTYEAIENTLEIELKALTGKLN